MKVNTWGSNPLRVFSYLYSMNWTHNGKIIKQTPATWYGFVYVITDNRGTKYWGKKAFTHRKKKRLSKKARKETGKRVEISRIDSGWQNYWGSSKPLLEYIKTNGTKGFRREILKLCKDKSSLSYWETHYLFQESVLFKDTWNGHILRFFKGKIHE